ncbi:hypothetical protein [Microvirga thermotolerans]|uniref:Uncharacterized protein n=1 Tax=Microvirga thermotolerans TaxID=2651334 RepID=A0A5P9JY44_9HYPH|nr:hypothetical protein [Microvirga thermotolerans]QFU16330.1 hypothetical protein GDR74_08885 [Microvirga thermotolerans]
MGAAAGAMMMVLPSLAVAADFGLTVDLSFSPKAAAKLSSLSEGVVVAAFFSGPPTPAARKRADETGRIFLGNEKVTVESDVRSARLTGRVVPRNRLDWVEDRKVEVLVNVYSARRRGPDNILDCDVFEGEVAEAAKAPVRIGCKLIGE